MGEFRTSTPSFSAYLIVFTVVVLSFCQVESKSQHRCPQEFNCGHIPQVSFPFSIKSRPDCGFWMLDCDAIPHPIIEFGEERYEVRAIGNDFTLFFYPLLQNYLQNRSSNTFHINLSFPNSPLISSHFLLHSNLTLFRCRSSLQHSRFFNEYESYHGCENFSVFYRYNTEKNHINIPIGKIPIDCSPIQLPFNPFNGSDDLFKKLSATIHLTWKVSDDCLECHYKGGQCLLDNGNKFHCLKGKNKRKVILITVLGSLAFIISLSLGVICVLRHRKKARNGYSHFSSKREGICMGVPVFSYSELVKATNDFDSSKELGDGGFGTVYHGKLRDGREVAVKRLYEHNCKRMEQFINEIEILTGLRHRNLVTLYGCSSRSSRELLLVYEYIPNGTLEEHLHGKRAKDGLLVWPIRMSIALETAKALAYLHASDIIHRDVKTANILLDHNFCVKVADFGISRLFPNNVTHVSTAPQGTPGYVDPEYHECYHLTNKSDVYSFGVVLIELISSMPAVDMRRHKQEINLANFAMNKILRRAYNELIDPSLGFETDIEVLRMTTSVAELAFGCIQHEKDMRPTMDDVLETLKEIQGGEYKGEEDKEANFLRSMEVPPLPESEHVILSKNNRFPASPNSVIDKWISSSSTIDNSG